MCLHSANYIVLLFLQILSLLRQSRFLKMYVLTFNVSFSLLMPVTAYKKLHFQYYTQLLAHVANGNLS